MTDKTIIGHLRWIRTTKGYTAVKHEAAIRSQSQPETIKRWDEETIGTPTPLDEVDWRRSLTELMLVYPMTEAQLKEYREGRKES